MNRIKNSRAAVVGVCLLTLLLGIGTVTARAQVRPVVLGTAETDNKFTWMVYVNGLGGGLGCRGVLIAPRWVLTAAHCIGSLVQGGEIFYTRTNPLTGVTTSGKQVQSGPNAKIIKHPNYRAGYPDNDLALVKMPAAFPPDPLLQTAELPTAPAFQGQQGTVVNNNTGNGGTVLAPGQVAVLRGTVSFAGTNYFTAHSLNASLCPGDSGSGFMTLRQGLNVVTGIASQGVLGDCTQPNLEFDAVDVFRHLDWITSTTSTIGPALLPGNTIPADVVDADYDGDGKIDLALKTVLGDWKIDFASNGFGFWDVIYAAYGGPDAHAVPADYDGDRKADLSVKSDGGVWYIDFAANGFGHWDVSFSGYGGPDAHPVPADYDGDGKADLSVKTDGGVWYIDFAKAASRLALTGFSTTPAFGRWDVWYAGYGGADAHPVPADYDGDGKADLSVKTDGGVWYIDYAANGFGAWNASYAGYGSLDAHPIPADYDGDRKADLSVKSDGGVWYIDHAPAFGAWNILYSGWGNAFVQAVPGDYDGDLKPDLAVYDPSNDAWVIDFAKDGFAGANVRVLEAP